jgi:hypothetical protein
LSFPPVANIVLPHVLSILQIALIDKELPPPVAPEATSVEPAGVPTLVVAEF